MSTWRVWLGDVRSTLSQIPDKTVQTCVTSPPYFGLRDYGTATWEGGDPTCEHSVGGQVSDSKAPGAIVSGVRPGVDASRCRKCGAARIDSQIGLEPTPDAYVAQLVAVFREVRRVLRDDGTVWLNLGDSYAAARGGTTPPAETLAGGEGGWMPDGARVNRDRKDGYNASRNAPAIGLKHKDLIGIPWRVAFALQADGWYLRSDIIWHKPNPMPESVADRPTKAHEYVFLLTKSERYYYDADAIKEPVSESSIQRVSQNGGNPTFSSARERRASGHGGRENMRPDQLVNIKAGRNKRSVWTISEVEVQWTHKAGLCLRCGGLRVAAADGSSIVLSALRPTCVCEAVEDKRDVWTVTTQPYSGAHFATFPEDLIEPCILAGTSAKGQCSLCGAPWERLVEKGDPDIEHQRACGGDVAGEYHGQATKAYAGTGAQDPSAVKARILKGMRQTTAVHWHQTCACVGAEVVPQIVLDPFTGSGTTGAVAVRLQRSFEGCELNPEYRALARQRIGAVSPLFAREIED